MTGSFSDATRHLGFHAHESYHGFPGIDDFVSVNIFPHPTGTHCPEVHWTSREEIVIDQMWDRMHIKPQPVIVQCGACGSHNAISNPTCVQCGAPMSWSKRVVYG